MKRTLKITYLILGILLSLAIGSSLVLSSANRPLDRDNSALISFEVEHGDTTEDIAGRLLEAGLIDSRDKYLLISKVWRYDGKYIAGSYSLSSDMTKSEIAGVLTNGPSDLLSFTVPPGITIYELAELLDGQGYVDRDTFIKEAEEGDYSQFDFLDDAQEGKDHLEGYLYPNTYYLDKGASEHDFIITMLNQFDIAFTDAYINRADELGYTVNDIIIIASLIEKKHVSDADKPRAALEIYESLESGEMELPAGPVCSPGGEAIKAALYPEDKA